MSRDGSPDGTRDSRTRALYRAVKVNNQERRSRGRTLYVVLREHAAYVANTPALLDTRTPAYVRIHTRAHTRVYIIIYVHYRRYSTVKGDHRKLKITD